MWALAIVWIITDPLTGAHSSPTQRCMQNVTLLLVAAACTTLVVWLVQGIAMGPRYTSDRLFELGYQAGRADALSETRPSLAVVAPFPSQHGQTGT